jgi:hypothetical protein
MRVHEIRVLCLPARRCLENWSNCVIMSALASPVPAERSSGKLDSPGPFEPARRPSG